MRTQAMDSLIPAVAAHQILNPAEDTQGDADGDWRNDAIMAHSTRPPRLGDDLIFPQSSSPEGTIYGNGNAARHLWRDRNQSYRGREGMWCASLPVGDKSGDGLWMGTCRKTGEHDERSYETHLPGLITPVHDHREEILTFSNGLDTSQHANQLHSSPSMKNNNIDDVDRRHSLQDDPEKEFHDGFVTQIYNYLSLGYPCVAHYYDHELSQISSIPVKELRRDDLETDAKGYVNVTGDAAVGANTKSAGRTCMRWVALRLYIHDWARQQPRVAKNDSNIEAWGVCERKGSWAV